MSQSDVQMQHVTDAVKHHDAAALEELFSPHARAAAPELKSGIKYFLSLFPSGQLKWSDDSVSSAGTDTSKETFGTYDVSANGKKYYLYLVYFSVDQVEGPSGVGLYALGITQYGKHHTDNPAFDTWARQFGNDNGNTTGAPGIYVPQKSG